MFGEQLLMYFLCFVGPGGEPLAVFVGEGHKEELLMYTSVALMYFKSLNVISNGDLPLQPAKHLLPSKGDGTLLFPSKVEVFRNEKGEYLVISDTGNNRILVANVSGNVEYVIGGPDPGFCDGNFDTAKFNAPQGACVLDDTIYVADNENHAIRKVNILSTFSYIRSRQVHIVTIVDRFGEKNCKYGCRYGFSRPRLCRWENW